MAYYIKIQNPREFRRSILESSKKTLSLLQSYRNLMKLRAYKRQLFVQLQDDIKELTLLSQKLDGAMPEKQLREEAMREITSKPQSIKVVKVVKSAKPDGEEELIAGALSRIEQKLKSLK